MTATAPDPLLLVELVGALVAYVVAAGSLRRWDRRRTLCWVGGLAAIAFALGPLDAAADSELPAHMAQHMVLLFVAAPLILLAAPWTLLLATVSPQTGRALVHAGRAPLARMALSPVFTLSLYAVLILGIHLPAIYDAALAHPAMHAFEHLGFLLAGLLLWAPVLAVAPLPRHLSPLAAAFYLMVAMVPDGLVGLWLMVADKPLYSAYADGPLREAISSQWLAGMLMWSVCASVLGVSLVVITWRGMQREERRQQIRERAAEALGGLGAVDGGGA